MYPFCSLSEQAFNTIPDKANFRIVSMKFTKSNRYANLAGLYIVTSDGQSFSVGDNIFFDMHRQHEFNIEKLPVSEIFF